MPTFRIHPPAHRRGRLVLPPPLFQLPAPPRPAANSNGRLDAAGSRVHQASVLAAAGAVFGAALGSCAALAVALIGR